MKTIETLLGLLSQCGPRRIRCRITFKLSKDGISDFYIILSMTETAYISIFPKGPLESSVIA
jgi:hypothetical protein